MDCRPDRSAAKGRLAGPLVAGDEQEDALAGGDRLLERSVDCAPRAVEAHAVEVDDSIGLNAAAAETPIPASIEGRADTALRR